MSKCPNEFYFRSNSFLFFFYLGECEHAPNSKVMQSCFLLLGKPLGSSTPTRQEMKHHEETAFLMMPPPLLGNYCTSKYSFTNQHHANSGLPPKTITVKWKKKKRESVCFALFALWGFRIKLGRSAAIPLLQSLQITLTVCAHFS